MHDSWCSAQAPTKRRLKRITKKENGDGKASVELPNDSPAAQEQAKLAGKQEQKKENKVRPLVCAQVLIVRLCQV